MSGKLRVGIVGCGILGTNHAQFFARHKRATVVAVADRLPGRAAKVAEDIGARAYDGHEAMLAGEALDLVVVATPDPFHRDPVLAAAARGVPNIVTEKPMATSVSDAEAMLAAAGRAGSRLWVHLPSRCGPAEIATRYVVQEGLIGAPIYGDLTVDDNISVPTYMWRDRSKEWAAGSSVAQFLFSHVVDRMRWIFEPAEVEEIRAITVGRVLGVTPDVFDAHLTWSNGLVLRVKAEWIRHMENLVDGRFTLSGERGGIVNHTNPGFAVEGGWQATLDPSVSASQLEAHQQALQERGVIARAIMRRPHPDVEGEGPRPSLEVTRKFLPLFGGDAEPTMRDHIIAAILEGVDEPPTWKGGGRLPTGEDGLVQTRIVCGIEEAARTGAVVRLGSPSGAVA
ncbi:MAG TPA: Gfo/Idh/MocA family oxidoreductase [Chloroflexota bacterium]